MPIIAGTEEQLAALIRLPIAYVILTPQNGA
jgi:hypothetical protein